MLLLRRAHVQTFEHVRALWTVTSHRLFFGYVGISTMKRPASSFTESQSSKRVRIGLPDSDDSGETHGAEWPARKEEMEPARRFILEWSDPKPYSTLFAQLLTPGSATAKAKTLIVFDKDADGLASGSILQQTLILLGLPASLITTHFVQRGNNIHDPSERTAMTKLCPSYVFVLDQQRLPY